MRLAVLVLAALVAICPNTQAAIQYVFKESEYTLAETGTADTTTVELIRTCSPTDPACAITGSTTVEISTDCPTECETMPGVYVATEGASADYTINNVNKIITFSTNPSVTDQAVSITVHNDAIEEKREYFCLSVVDPDVRGTQWSTRVIIPWNDHCVAHYSPPDGGAGTISPGYDIHAAGSAVTSYVGPWSHAIMPTLTIEVTPQHSDYSGDGDDINLFLATTPDQSDTVGTFNYYGIFLDNANAAANTFGPQTAGASFVTDDSLNTLVGAEETDGQITPDVTNTLQLQFSYSASSTTVDIQRTAPTTSIALDETENTNTYNIGHLFVSAAEDKYANWKICGLVPRRLNAVDCGAIASGHFSEFHAGRAIDGVRDPNGKCFVSADDSSNKNWLRIDLGRVLHVQKVIIFPVADVPGIRLDTDINSARVYVGSCNPADTLADISRMHACDSDIGTVDGADIVEVTCNTGVATYGQYVYILPDVDGARLSLCEVEVYGDEIPIDDEPKVEFTSSASDNTFSVTEGTAQATLTLTRSVVSGNTCTYVDYHTSDIDTGGFTVIPSTKPSTVSWLGSSVTAQQTINIDITQDNLCEPPETFNVYLTDVVGANLGTFCYTTVNIADDDSMTYTIVPPSSSISEGDGPLSISVTRTGTGINQEGRASLMFTDISATSNDYANIPLQLDTFASTTSSSQMIGGDVPIKTDECWEESETFSVALGDLSPSTCSQQGTPLTVEVEVTDDDSKFYWRITSDTKTITLTEGSGTTDVTIMRIGTAQSKTVEFTVDHDSTESDDFSISPSSGEVPFQISDDDEKITITVADDDDVEETETFTLTLRDPLGENCCNGNLEDPFRITVQITDNDAEYFWKEPSYSIEEGENLLVCLERTGDTTTAQTVDITSAGISALSGVDFTPISPILFQPSDAGEKCAVVTIADNSVPEGVETFTLTINSGEYEIDESRRITTVTITDNDANVSWERPTYIATEGFGNSVTATITKTGNQEVSVVVSTGSGTATSGLDFTPISTTITIPANQNSYPVTIAILDDDIDDNSETFTITLSSISAGSITSPSTTVSITDDDLPPTVPPPDDDGLSGGAIAGIVVAAVVGLLVILGAVAFLIFMMGGAGAGAAAAGAAGTAGAVSAYGAQPGTSAGAYGLQNFSFGNGYGNSYGVNGYGGNKPYGFP